MEDGTRARGRVCDNGNIQGARQGGAPACDVRASARARARVGERACALSAIVACEGEREARARECVCECDCKRESLTRTVLRNDYILSRQERSERPEVDSRSREKLGS